MIHNTSHFDEKGLDDDVGGVCGKCYGICQSRFQQDKMRENVTKAFQAFVCGITSFKKYF